MMPSTLEDRIVSSDSLPALLTFYVSGIVRLDRSLAGHGHGKRFPQSRCALLLACGAFAPGKLPHLSGSQCGGVDAWRAARHDSAKGEGHVISDIDIWRSANELIKQFGDTADIEAATRADALLAKGDLDGRRVWLRILKVIDALRSDQRRGPTH